MNSLVSGILLISSVLTLGFGTDLTVSMNDINSQRAGVDAALGKSQAKSVNNIRLNEQINPYQPTFHIDSIFTFGQFEVQLSATEWDWRIRKMGTFAGQVLNCTVRSSHDILVDFSGFANLTDANSGIQINTWYAISQTYPPPPQSGTWISASALNQSDFVIQHPVHGVSWNLWCMLEVTNNIKASEYHNNPTITFVNQGVETWIDPGFTLDEITDITNQLQSGKN
jgi:hypothetical protein